MLISFSIDCTRINDSIFSTKAQFIQLLSSSWWVQLYIARIEVFIFIVINHMSMAFFEDQIMLIFVTYFTVYF